MSGKRSITKRHLDVLAAALVVRVLQPWHENLSKRQVRSPKAYIRDSGLLHTLLGIGSLNELARNPKLGASWKGFVIEQIFAKSKAQSAYYWRTQAGAELDLLLLDRGRRIGVEVKYGDAPKITPSLSTACADLKLQSLLVVYPGDRTYELAPKVSVMPLSQALEELS